MGSFSFPFPLYSSVPTLFPAEVSPVRCLTCVPDSLTQYCSQCAWFLASECGIRFHWVHPSLCPLTLLYAPAMGATPWPSMCVWLCGPVRVLQEFKFGRFWTTESCQIDMELELQFLELELNELLGSERRCLSEVVLACQQQGRYKY